MIATLWDYRKAQNCSECSSCQEIVVCKLGLTLGSEQWDCGSCKYTTSIPTPYNQLSGARTSMLFGSIVELVGEVNDIYIAGEAEKLA